MSPYIAYLLTIAVIVSVLAAGVQIANLLHFRQTEKKLRNLGKKDLP